MANSLFIQNNYLVIPPARVSASSFSSKPIAPQPLLCFSVTNSAPLVLQCRSSSRRASFFKSHLSARGSVPPVNAKEDNVDSSGADQQHLPSLRTLLKVYKDAIFNEDENTVSEIEARMEVIENKQNELVQKVSSISAEVTSGKEKLIRLQADFDNCRKRFEKERLTVRTDAQGEVIESLLPMVDNFERAKQQIRPETEKEKKIDTSYQGIYKQFVEIMRSLRVASVPTKGKPFDPSVHEAIAREESQEFPEGIVIQEIRRGFLLGGRLLRPAMVKVSIGPGSKKSPVATEKSSGSPGTAASVEN
ncbi:uncharacterized protein LOC133744091 [Rosa rugosa]|uniref:uncharacterized protein LOC133744091 n=1 Tax=Rosa rugosa TaxID=74645 RepID=UPI002B415C56|nr:uncharacterized protein LOC133744091 [Rosa rugosa]